MLFTALEGLGVELGVRWRAADHGGNLSQSLSQYVERIRVLSGAISYTSNRFTDILFRQQEIDWKKEVLAYVPKSDVFDQASDPKASSWRMFMGLSIKDFHVDIVSLMDALAPVLIQTESKLKPKDVNRLPGWATIQRGTKCSYRKELSHDLCKIIDGTDRWWPSVKEVRNLLTHRKHDRIIFGNSEDGLLFQIYDQTMRPSIELPSVLYRKEKYVVDFDFYSAFIFAELIILFDEIGNAIASKLGITRNNLAQMCQREVVKSVAKSIERLIQATEKLLSRVGP
jgi:hypothetical protein